MIFGRRPHRRADDIAAIRAVMQSFESLGDNCEFGLAQRFCGVEPLGLFRFASVALEPLIAALDTDFREYGSESDLVIAPTSPVGFVCRSRRFGFTHHTGDIASNGDAESVLRRETVKVAYLKRRLLEDLASGDKVLIRKAAARETRADASRLVAAVARHGPCRVLYVRETGAGGVTVRRDDDGLIEGALPRFAPEETAHALDLEAWIALCTQTSRLVHGAEKALPHPAKRRNRLSRPWRRGGQHVLTDGLEYELLGDYQRARGLTLGEIHVYSAWVWIPASFTGTRIDATIGGQRLGWRDADVSLRDAWQRVWAADRLPESFHVLMMGLVASGAGGARFWSAGHRLEEGPVPGPGAPPRWTPRT